MAFVRAEAICKLLGITPSKLREIIKSADLRGIDGEWDADEVAQACLDLLKARSSRKIH